jgi:hypothetical protein
MLLHSAGARAACVGPARWRACNRVLVPLPRGALHFVGRHLPRPASDLPPRLAGTNIDDLSKVIEFLRASPRDRAGLVAEPVYEASRASPGTWPGRRNAGSKLAECFPYFGRPLHAELGCRKFESWVEFPSHVFSPTETFHTSLRRRSEIPLQFAAGVICGVWSAEVAEWQTRWIQNPLPVRV